MAADDGRDGVRDEDGQAVTRGERRERRRRRRMAVHGRSLEAILNAIKKRARGEPPPGDREPPSGR